MVKDKFLRKVTRAVNYGIRHHQSVLKKAYEFNELSLLLRTERMPDDRKWWTIRAAIIACDADRQPVVCLMLRRN